MKLAKIRAKSAELVKASDGVVLGGASTSVLHTVRRAIQGLIPGDFHWWLEIDSDIRLSVHWIWLGHSAVSHVGGRSDFDIQILLELVRGVNWFLEREVAIESVEGYEQEALKAAQEKRRRRAVGRADAKLKQVDIPEPPPLSVDGKRLVHRVGVGRAGYAAAVDEKLRKQMSEAAAKPVSVEIRRYQDGRNRGVPEYGLTRSKGYIMRYWEWEAFDSLHEFQERLASEPEGSFTHTAVSFIVADNVPQWRDAAVFARPIRELNSAIFEAQQRGEDVSKLSARLQAVIRGESI